MGRPVALQPPPERRELGRPHGVPWPGSPGGGPRRVRQGRSRSDRPDCGVRSRGRRLRRFPAAAASAAWLVSTSMALSARVSSMVSRAPPVRTTSGSKRCREAGRRNHGAQRAAVSRAMPAKRRPALRARSGASRCLPARWTRLNTAPSSTGDARRTRPAPRRAAGRPSRPPAHATGAGAWGRCRASAVSTACQRTRPSAAASRRPPPPVVLRRPAPLIVNATAGGHRPHPARIPSRTLDLWIAEAARKRRAPARRGGRRRSARPASGAP